MSTDSEESLRQTLIEVEHLRQCEAMHRRNAESLLEGLQRLSIAQSQQDSLLSVLSILLDVLNIGSVAILVRDEAGDVSCLAAAGDPARLPVGAAAEPLARAFAGRTILLNDSTGSGCLLADGAAGAAMLQPVGIPESEALIVCLRPRRAGFSPADRDKIRFFLPLVSHGIRHSAKLSELQRAVQELETARTEAERSARRDELSGLANRKAMDEAFAEVLAGPEANSCCCAIIDLDDFKPINDTFGHDVGDVVLREIGRRLQVWVGARGLAARLGGDEFAILSCEPAGDEAVDRLGRALVELFALPIHHGGREFAIRASIGIARVGVAGTTTQEVVSAADKAMYSIKHKKETAFAIYDPKVFNKGISRFERQRLLEAIRSWEIRPYFQPKVDLATGQVVGAEALARWVEPDRPPVLPGAFLPVIEDHGLQAEFTVAIARQVVACVRRWTAFAASDFNVAINVPEATLATQSGLEELLWILDEHGIGHRITCEITEDVFIARSSDVIRDSIAELRASGVRVSLDDFGTGYGSFRHLQELHIDELKIDTRIVAGIGRQKSAEIIIEGFIAIARGLDIAVVAEGIETAEQAEFLRDRGCRLGQGYLYGHAVPAVEFARRLHAAHGSAHRQQA